MSSEDSFINEVSEEVRRDRLYGYVRRYGWIAATAVIVLVGGAAWNEWRKATARAEAQALGDGILEALEGDTAEARAQALSSLPAEGTAATLLAMLSAAEVAEGDNRAAALDRLDAVAADPALDPLYRDLAQLKAVILRGRDLSPEDRLLRLSSLAAPGAPYRVLALELTALAHVDAGEPETAIDILQEIIADDGATEALRRRASQLIVVLGGSLSAT